MAQNVSSKHWSFRPEPAKDAAHLARLIDRDVKAEPDGAAAVPSGSDRADFIFLTREQLGRRYPEVSLAGLPERGGAGLVLATSDLAVAEKAVGSAGRPQRSGCLRRAGGGQWYAARFHPGLGLRRTFSLSMMLPRMPLGRKMMKITSSTP